MSMLPITIAIFFLFFMLATLQEYKMTKTIRLNKIIAVNILIIILNYMY